MSGLTASALAADVVKGRLFPSEAWRFVDPATEFELDRLTDPAHTSRLPAYYNRAVSKRGGFMLFCSDRTGSFQAFRMDLASGGTRQLTDAEALDPPSVTLMPDERAFCYFDGPVLRLASLASLREREVYFVPDGWKRCPGASVTGDGLYAVFGESNGTTARLRLVSLLRKTPVATLAEAPFEVADPVARPRRAQVLYRQGDKALWLVNFDGQQNRRLMTAPGALGPAQWAPDGRTIFYLNFPEIKQQLNSLRELTPDENTDKLLAQTSQFVQFAVNGDASVFVGASRNRASPHLLLLVRLARRELTLCEHRSSDPALVAPVFAPDSQKVYFQSDKHGKPAIYRLAVERFVEKTESDA